ncbi:hypothetical protein AVEN_260093-1 [Araneus ventricosus]|uniref:Uncharacterized protein n=1 Tax=Araneus ventricosus TaxID=182803 RepID=A0A4Y2G2I6_ARAVE|nr:hypothetical protein AVEN_260093-1 [Araneus ventricosus]
MKKVYSEMPLTIPQLIERKKLTEDDDEAVMRCMLAPWLLYLRNSPTERSTEAIYIQISDVSFTPEQIRGSSKGTNRSDFDQKERIR